MSKNSTGSRFSVVIARSTAASNSSPSCCTVQTSIVTVTGTTRGSLTPSAGASSKRELELVLAVKGDVDESLRAQGGLAAAGVFWFEDEIGPKLEVEQAASPALHTPVQVHIPAVVDLDLVAVIVPRPPSIYN
ncbi:electron transfer flavoprotein subunit beta [Striga asiatica]|uniref:Electron transfer flavoprotein subunit beta n=1 Tax=Striga asiatica TaxID=4170 RepID=A0A5A7QBK8_STRAF|nr:electron transfer flavoprotein subunit beta [Striga asiatica]